MVQVGEAALCCHLVSEVLTAPQRPASRSAGSASPGKGRRGLAAPGCAWVGTRGDNGGKSCLESGRGLGGARGEYWKDGGWVGGGGSGVVLCGSRAALGQRKAIPGKLCDLQRRAWPALEHAPGAEERLLL